MQSIEANVNIIQLWNTCTFSVKSLNVTFNLIIAILRCNTKSPVGIFVLFDDKWILSQKFQVESNK